MPFEATVVQLLLLLKVLMSELLTTEIALGHKAKEMVTLGSYSATWITSSISASLIQRMI